MGATRSLPMRAVWPDEYIEQWGQIYIDNPTLRRRGILFETFLQSPREILFAVSSACHAISETEYLPLLAAQRAVAARSDSGYQQLADQLVEAIPQTGPQPLRWGNGAIVEPLAHCKHPDRRRGRSGFRPARA